MWPKLRRHLPGELQAPAGNAAAGSPRSPEIVSEGVSAGRRDGPTSKSTLKRRRFVADGNSCLLLGTPVSMRWATEAMVDTFRYRLVQYRRQPLLAGEREVEAILKVLSINDAQGWELDRFYDSGSDNGYRNILFEQRIPK